MSVYAPSANGDKGIRVATELENDPGFTKESGSPPKSNGFIPVAVLGKHIWGTWPLIIW